MDDDENDRASRMLADIFGRAWAGVTRPPLSDRVRALAIRAMTDGEDLTRTEIQELARSLLAQQADATRTTTAA